MSAGRPEKLTDELKVSITELQRDRKKKLKAPDVQDEIRLILENKAKEDHPRWSREEIGVEVADKLPGISSIQKYLKENEGRDKPSNLDSIWHLGTLKRYPLSPEGIARVFEIKCLYGRPPRRQEGAWGVSITIREAMWISRLSLLTVAPEELWNIARGYADAEFVSELSGIPFNSYQMDEQIYELLGYPKPENVTELQFPTKRGMMQYERTTKKKDRMRKDGEK